MIVSQFQIRNTPSSQTSTFYELLLTNLGDKPYSFNFLVHTDTSNLQNKATVLVDQASYAAQKPLQSQGNGRYQINTTFNVGAGRTARIRLRPFDTVNFGPSSNSLDAIGHVELTIPLAWTWGGSKVSQGSEPVDVLLHAYTINWQSGSPPNDATPIALASGQAVNQILPKQKFNWNSSVFESSEMVEYLRENNELVNGLVSDERNALAALVYLLDMTRGNKEQLAAVNRLLDDIDLPYAIESR